MKEQIEHGLQPTEVEDVVCRGLTNLVDVGLAVDGTAFHLIHFELCGFAFGSAFYKGTFKIKDEVFVVGFTVDEHGVQALLYDMDNVQ